MRMRRPVACCSVALTLASLAIAAPSRVLAQASKTSKERLSDKASDDQRVDNCRVPRDRRGAEPRPECEGDAAAASPAAGGSQGFAPARR